MNEASAFLKAAYIIISLLLVTITCTALVWSVKRMLQGKAARKFINNATDLHGRAYTAGTEQERREAREQFEQLVEMAVRTDNFYINNRNHAELLNGQVELVLDMVVADEQTDVEEARSWGERVKEKLRPMFFKERLGGKARTASEAGD
jgi:Rps23 Pro-64 3,4-dihydroxylase Tpa1-like proline 4-hydroxylase